MRDREAPLAFGVRSSGWAVGRADASVARRPGASPRSAEGPACGFTKVLPLRSIAPRSDRSPRGRWPLTANVAVARWVRFGCGEQELRLGLVGVNGLLVACRCPARSAQPHAIAGLQSRRLELGIEPLQPRDGFAALRGDRAKRVPRVHRDPLRPGAAWARAALPSRAASVAGRARSPTGPRAD